MKDVFNGMLGHDDTAMAAMADADDDTAKTLVVRDGEDDTVGYKHGLYR